MRRPRGRPELPKVGVFGDRGPRRPNRIGAAICQILAVSVRQLMVQGLDAVVGTPVLDIKPVMAEFLPAATRQPDWPAILMSEYFAHDLQGPDDLAAQLLFAATRRR